MDKELSRKKILDQIKLIMTDGLICTGREIPNLLEGKGFTVSNANFVGTAYVV